MLLWNCANVFNYTHKCYEWLHQLRKCQNEFYVSQKTHVQPWSEGFPSHSMWNWEESLCVVLHMMQCSSSSSCAVTSYHVAGTSMMVWIEERSRLSDVSFGGFAVSPVWGRRVFLKQISQLSTCIIEQFHELDCFQRKLNQKIHCKYIPNMPQSLIMRTATMNCPQHREVFQYESNAAKKRLLDTWEFVQHPQSTSSAI